MKPIKKKHGEFLHCSKYPVKLHSTSLAFSPWGPPVIALTLPWRPWQSREVFTKHGNPKEKRQGFFDLKRNDVYNYIYSICMCICKYIYIYIWYPPQKKPTFSHFVPVFTVFCAFLRTFFFKGIFLLILEVVFINVYKHRGSWILDPDLGFR